MTLAFFLDPNRPHGLGSLVIDALLETLDGAPLLRVNGPTGHLLQATDYQGSTAWELATQTEFIDVLATNVDTGLAVVLENKIGHVLDNPLAKYARSALSREGITDVVVVVIAPEPRSAPEGHEQWLSRSITYGQLITCIKATPALLEYVLNPADRDQRRSLELLQQFMEARTEGKRVGDLSDEAVRIEEWRDFVRVHRDAIEAFQRTQVEVRSIMAERRKRLEPYIADRLEQAGLRTDWESHSGGRADQWNAYHFSDFGWTIELKFSADPQQPEMFVYHYPGRTYRDTTVEDLGVTWADSDEAVVDAFTSRVTAILGQVTPLAERVERHEM